MNREKAQRRADAITFLRTANLEQVPTAALTVAADHLHNRGAFVVPPYKLENPGVPPVKP